MKFYCFFIVFAWAGLLCGACARAQAPDTVVTRPMQFARNLYAETIGDESHLYNGPQYINYAKSYLTGHQFFRTDQYRPAAILYDGTWYTQVPVLYDLVLDKIVLEHAATEFMLTLINEKVETFTLAQHTFIRVEKDTLTPSPVKTGFYDVLHHGNIQLLAKRSKIIQEQATPAGMEGRFEQNTKYYIRQENTYYPVKDKRSVLQVLPGKKKELQRYAREQKLQFRQNREKALLQLVRFYDQPAT